MISAYTDKGKIDVMNMFGGSSSNKVPSASFPRQLVDTEEKVQKVSPPRRKMSRDDKSEKVGNWPKKDTTSSTQLTTTFKQQNPPTSDKDNIVSRQPESPMDGNINDILEEEEALIAAHRKEIEDTMEIVREVSNSCYYSFLRCISCYSQVASPG